MKQGANIEELLMTVNPFTDKSFNDIVTYKAMEKNISAEAITGKVFPFISIDVANEVEKCGICSVML